MRTKPIKWTKADANRAAKMGFSISNGHLSYRICRHDAVFTTDREAAEWVVYAYKDPRYAQFDVEPAFPKLVNEQRATIVEATCRKALLLCATGGAS